jgi:hypothetical protein
MALRGSDIPAGGLGGWSIPAGVESIQVRVGGVMLFGSSILPSTIADGKGGAWQLGEVVNFAHKASGLSAAEWNAMPPLARELTLVAAAYAMREGKTFDEIEAMLDQALDPAGTVLQ